MDSQEPTATAATAAVGEGSAAAGRQPSTHLDRSLSSSIAWRAAADWTSQILTWASFLIVARLLSPSDFGIVSMAVILFVYLRYVGEFGIPATVVNLRTLTRHQLGQMNTLGVLLGLTCFGISCALAVPLADFFRTPKLAPVVMVTCSALIVLGVRAVPEGMLMKDMRFRWLALVNAGCDVLAAAVTLTLAFKGFAYWALVLGNLSSDVARSALLVRARPQPFYLPRFKSIRKELQFGWHVLVSTLAWQSCSKLDTATAGRVLGPAPLGSYSIAWELANVPLEKITTLVTTVAPSYLAAVQADLAALRRYVRVLTEFISLVTFPATVGLSLVARDLVPLVLGKKWQPAIPILEVLAFYAAFRSVGALLTKVLNAMHRARFVMWNQLAALILLPTSFYIGSHWGAVGIAWGWVAAYPLVVLPLYWKTFRTIDMQVGEYLRSLKPALSGTAVMIVCVVALRMAVLPGRSAIVQLVVEVLAGAAGYAGALLLFHRQRITGFLTMLKGVRQGRVEN